MRKACAEAVEELKEARNLLKTQKAEIETQTRLIDVQTEIEVGLKNLNELSSREKDELRKALTAKDRVISSLETANIELKRKKMTLWKLTKITLVAFATGVITEKFWK